MLRVELKQVETAINSGRLDEAFAMLRESTSRLHRDGQSLVDRLIVELHDRSKAHLEAARLSEARADIEMAKELGGGKTALAELAAEIAASEDQQRAQRRQQDQLKQLADKRHQDGAFSLAGELAAKAESETLVRRLDQDRKTVDHVARRLEELVQAEQFDSAASLIASLDASVRAHEVVVEKAQSLSAVLLSRAVEAFRGGRLDRADQFHRHLVAISVTNQETEELGRWLQRSHAAQMFLRKGDYVAADRELGLLDQTAGEAEWVSATRATVSEMDRLGRQLKSGPLGLLDQVLSAPASASLPAASPAANVPAVTSVLPSAKPAGAGGYLLQVDGIGSILLLQGDEVTLGSVSHSAVYDLPLQTDGPRDPVVVRRSGEDYFAQSEAPFGINDQPTRRHLLQSNDAIGFGRRGRVRFRKPCPASASAVLEITGASLPRRDIRHIALLADSLVFAGSGGHYSIRSAEEPIILYRSGDGIAIKRPGGRGNTPMELGKSCVMGDARFVLNRVTLC